MAELPDDLLLKIFLSTPETTARAFELNHTFHSAAKEVLLDRLPPHVDQVLDEAETMLQGDVCALLMLSADKVRLYPHESRRRYGGGEYHVFDIETIRCMLAAEGGARGFHQRVAAKAKRDASKRKRDDGMRERVSAAEKELDAGLCALGLVRRSDSTLCAEYVASAGKSHDIRFVLSKMAQMHYLHEHTDGAYRKAVEINVLDRGEHKGYHKGIYNFCAIETQDYDPRFRLPATLPWMTTMKAKAAINAAVEAAVEARLATDPAALAKRQKSLALAAKRRAALEARLAAFAKERAGNTSFTTAAELRAAVAAGYKGTVFDFGNFFDEVVKPSVGVKALVELAERLEVARLATG